MSKKIKFLFKSMLIIAITVPTLWYSSQCYWQNKTKKLYKIAQKKYNKMYTYEFFSGALDQTIYAENIHDAKKMSVYYSEISNYYNKVKNGDIKKKKVYVGFECCDSAYAEPVSIPVKFKTIGVEKSIYVENINNNKDYVKAYVFNTYCWGYYVAYIAKSTIHKNLPPDSLLTKFYEHLETLPESNGIYGSLSPYGFYCN